MSYIGKAPGFGIRNRYYYTATSSQTLFSGADDNGQTLAYADSKYLDVYLNGVLLVAGTDYTATTLTSVSLTTGAAASDIVEIVAYDIFSVADTVSASNGGTFNGNITIDGDLTASSIAYPTTDGTSGQVITTDGSGTLSFTTLASDKIEEGNSSVEVVDTGTGYVAVTVDGTEEARFNSTGLGIATNSPSHPLHVLATAAGETTVKIESNQAGAMNVALDVDTDRDLVLQFQEAGTTRWDFLMNGSSGTNQLKIRDDDGTTQGEFDQSGNFKFNSGYGSAATAYGCRAWVNFNGTGTVAIRDSGNVSSITDNNTGDYTVNFTTAMPDANYCAVASTGRDSTGGANLGASFNFAGTAPTTSAIRMNTRDRDGGSNFDTDYAFVAIFR